MKTKKQSLLIALFAIVLIACDQISKSMIVQRFSVGEKTDIIPDIFYITYVQNTGAGFSLFEGFGVLFFSIITLIAIGVIGYYFFTTKKPIVRWLLAIVFAGAVGNFIDRLMLGYVRDFIGVNIIGWSFPVFNLADIYITCGFIALGLWMMVEENQEKKGAEAEHGKEDH